MRPQTLKLTLKIKLIEANSYEFQETNLEANPDENETNNNSLNSEYEDGVSCV